jgi:putative tryptophan/tyrosine transport system substrate-binding protein
MKRRQFISLVGAAAATPLLYSPVARAQKAAMPVIGFLHSGAPEQNVKRLAAWRKGLDDVGFVEDRNVTIEYRWAGGRNDRLPDLASDLIHRQVAVIVTAGSTPAALAAKAATTTIPIVFGAGADPVELGLVPSLNRPGGNVTGVTSLNAEVAAKRLGMFRDLVPQAAHYFAFVNPTSALAELFIKDLQAGAATVGIHVDILRASTDAEIEAAFASLPHEAGNVLVFGPDAFFFIRRAQIAALMARHAIPSVHDARDYVEAGGLMSYGADFLNVMQLAGGYTGRILKGEKPADLPVMLSTKYELVINLKTAKALGLTVPDRLLALADEVIE